MDAAQLELPQEVQVDWQHYQVCFHPESRV
jgi:hypothetical protein